MISCEAACDGNGLVHGIKGMSIIISCAPLIETNVEKRF